MKYSILIIALDCHYSHMTRFVCNLKQENPNAEIHFLSDKEKEDIPDAIINSVDEVIYHRLSGGEGYLGVVKKLYSLRKHFRKLSQKSKYDIINIHFPHYYISIVMPYLKKMSANIVVSVWGSDVMRVNGWQLKVLLRGVLTKCNYISISAKGILGKHILELVPGIYDKFYPQSWGSETIDYIIKHKDEIDTQIAKYLFGLADKFVITCGYNAFPAQNHDKIIDAIVQIRSQLPENLILLFPVSYGAYDKDDYVAKLKKRCQEEQIDALFIEEYISVSDVFKLRMATDMFIHVQNTDAGNTTILEYVLCGKKIIHGSWIQYSRLESYSPLCFHKVSDFSTLGDTILETFYSKPIQVSQETIDYIQSRGWEVRRKEWNEMFEILASSVKNDKGKKYGK